jgi:hypothetical protein
VVRGDQRPLTSTSRDASRDVRDKERPKSKTLRWYDAMPDMPSVPGQTRLPSIRELLNSPIGTIGGGQYNLVLGKFGLKLIQTRFEPNRNRKFRFRFGKSSLKPNGLICGFGLGWVLQTVSNAV